MYFFKLCELCELNRMLHCNGQNQKHCTKIACKHVFNFTHHTALDMSCKTATDTALEAAGLWLIV